MTDITTLLTASIDAPYASDAPVREDLATFGFADLRTFLQDEHVRSYRARLRYLAALFPKMAIAPLAESIHAVVDNSDLSVSDVRTILDGCRLDDPSKKTSEVSLSSIQKVGEVLIGGGAKLQAAREAGVSVDTVETIDDYLGLTQRVEDKLMDFAVAAAREGWSVGKLAKVSGMSRSRAHRYLVRARAVLVEIGEVA